MKNHFKDFKGVSLRGSLANDFMALSSIFGVSERMLEMYLNGLLNNDDPKIIVTEENGKLLIGKVIERGLLDPDW